MQTTSTLRNDLLLEVEKLSPIAQKELKEWAEIIQIIQNEKIAKPKKIIKIIEVSRKSSFKHIWWFVTRLGKHYWKTSSWSIRFFILAIPASIVVFGNKKIGIATSGFGIGVPVFLLTSAGITFIGVLLDVLNNGADAYKNTPTEYSSKKDVKITEQFNSYSEN
jgi:hypothetical protein